MKRASSALALTAALLLAACHKPTTDSASASASPSATADTPPLLAPEMRADASSWINGPPSPITSAHGNVVLIEAWDRFCIPCRQSVPAVLALKGRYGARGLRVISVAAFDDAPGERQLLADIAREAHMNYPCFLDLGSVWQHAAGTSGVIPLVLIADRQGVLTSREKGLLLQGTPAFDRLAAAIERALGGS